MIISLTIAFLFSSCSTDSHENISESNLSKIDTSSHIDLEISTDSTLPNKSNFLPELTENIKNDTSIIYIDTDKNLAEKFGKVDELYIDLKYPLPGAVVGDDGDLLIGDRIEDTSTMYLANLENKTIEPIYSCSNDKHFSEVYHDNEIIIFYEYTVWSTLGVPLNYYIYNKHDGSIDNLDIAKMSIPNEDVIYSIGEKFVRLEEYLYIEIQDSYSIYSEENSGELLEAGVSIYKYNLKTKEFEHVIKGFSPQIFEGELVYIKDKTDTLVKLSNGDTIAENVYEYATYKDTMVITKFSDYIDEKGSGYIDTYYYKNGKEEKIFSRKDSYSFWNYSLNDEYIAWYQISNNLYLYSIQDDGFVLITSKLGSRVAKISDKYIYWMSSEYSQENKEETKTTIQYVKF